MLYFYGNDFCGSCCQILISHLNSSQKMKKYNLLLILLWSVHLALAQNWQELDKKATSFYTINLDSAIFYAQKSVNVCYTALSAQDTACALCVGHLAQAYERKQKFMVADSLYNLAIGCFDKSNTKSVTLAELMNASATIKQHQNNFSGAERLFFKTRRLFAELIGKENHFYSSGCNNLGYLYREAGRYQESEALLQEARGIRERTVGKEDPAYAIVCNNLGLLYQSMGRYEESEAYAKEALYIREKKYGENSLLCATSYNNLGLLHKERGQHVLAEQFLLKSKEIRARLLGTQHHIYAAACNNLAALYQEQGRNAQALNFQKEALEINRKNNDKKSALYTKSLLNLATLVTDVSTDTDYAEAEQLIDEAATIRAEQYGRESAAYASVLVANARLSHVKKDIARSELLYQEAIEIMKKTSGEKNYQSISAMTLLLSLYIYAENYEKASLLGNNTLDLLEDIGSKESMDWFNIMSCMAIAYEGLLDYKKAIKAHSEAMRVFWYQIENNFDFLSEKEKSKFAAQLRNKAEMAYSMLLRHADPELSSLLLNNLLITKSMFFNTSQNMKRHIQNTKDNKLLQLYNDWSLVRKQLANATQMSNEYLKAQNISFDSLTETANALEKELSLKTSLQIDKKRVVWQDVQRQLKKNEAAVEVIRIWYHNKSYKDSVMYLAFITTPETSSSPLFVLLPNGNYLEKEGLSFYQNSIQYSHLDTFSYNSFWKPIQERIGAAKTVYFSGDGVFHQINLATLYNPQRKRYLHQSIKIQLLSSTRDLMLIQNTKKQTKNYKDYQIHLFGYPNYALKQAAMLSEPELKGVLEEQQEQNIKKLRFFNLSIGQVKELPATKVEVEQIVSMAQRQNIKTHIYLGNKATESSLKGLQSPSILHIATHGFFIKEEDNNSNLSMDNALTRSGLLLAGAEEGITLADKGEENGILTAQEAFGLNLNDTDLVVLSACETGLGDIQNGEGVNGLQRAFMQAGAKSILMSLWKVDDDATQKLMTLFYQNLLEKKQSKRLAFENAQSKLRKTYPEPYYWGAFVLLGE